MAVSHAGSMLTLANAEPWDYYERLRDEGGILWDDELQSWLVLSYEPIKEIALGEHELWDLPYVSRDDGEPPLGLTAQAWQDFVGYGSPRFLMTDRGDDHVRQHRWWMRAFSPRVLTQWQETLFRPIVDEEIDRFARAGRAELVADYARRVSPRVISAMLGLPHDDADLMARVEQLISARFAAKHMISLPNPDPAVIERAFRATDELKEILEPLVDERRAPDGDGLISMLWRDAPLVFGESWEPIDILAAAGVAWEGGTDTTASSTANGLQLLLSRPGLYDLIRGGDEELVRRFVEETIRLYGPVLFRPRVAREDVEVGGVQVKQGQQVLVLIVAANRDPDHYPDGSAVDLERRAPRDHLSFYFGPRSCPGQALARVELEAIFTQITARLPDLRLDPDAEPPRYTGTMTRRWAPLNVLFTPAP
jgi:cytochrome P450